MLPELDGFEVCRILRKEMSVPILMLTAKTGEVDKIVGLEMGADDYITKPFSVRELMARIRAVLRRSHWGEHRDAATASTDEVNLKVLQAGAIEINLVSHKVLRNDVELKLSPKEFELLSFLVSHRSQVFNREYLVEKIWKYDYDGTARTVDVHIRSLRRKIEDNPEQPKYIVTVHGFGYKFNE
jgi:DNA-binding response OmpR family regulator